VKKSAIAGMVLICFFLYSLPCYCTESSPEQFVREFYTWYFKADREDFPAEKNNEIFRYVSRQTVKNLQVRNSRIYYFTKVGSYSSEWAQMELIVMGYSRITDDLFIVPVTFRVTSKDICVIVVLKCENDSFLITKVIDPRFNF
jgi:hypothetical protein